ncbi:hypothetical protein FOZ62_019600, partial [Perkinsus olseni]
KAEPDILVFNHNIDQFIDALMEAKALVIGALNDFVTAHPVDTDRFDTEPAGRAPYGFRLLKETERTNSALKSRLIALRPMFMKNRSPKLGSHISFDTIPWASCHAPVTSVQCFGKVTVVKALI